MSGNEIAIIDRVRERPAILLVEPDTVEPFFGALKREIEAEKVDLTTATGRKAVASLAHKITRTKTAMDDAGKELTEEARKRVAAINAARKELRERFETLAADTRRPLTEWENAEKARQERVDETLRNLASLTVIPADATLDGLREAQAETQSLDASDPAWGDDGALIGAERMRAINALTAGIERIERQEEDRRELERLRAERAEREAREAAEREAKAEAERQAREAAETERRENERREEAARQERERIEREHRQEQERQAAAHQAELDRIAAEREQERRERERVEREAREREEVERQKQAEIDARAADVAHRSRVMRQAKEAIIRCGVEEDVAKTIILAIKADEIPHVSLTF